MQTIHMIINHLPAHPLPVRRIPSQAIRIITIHLQAHSLLVRRIQAQAIYLIINRLSAHSLLVRRKILRLYFWAGSGINEIIYTAGKTGLWLEKP